jgi:HSP20 family protein
MSFARSHLEAVMAIIRYEPLRDPFEQLMSLAASGKRAALAMPIDVYRAADGSYHLEADVPGADPGTIEVTVEHSTLSLRAQRSAKYGDADQVVAAERPQGQFSRQLTLGDGVDPDHLTASYTDGVLHVIIPESPKVQPRRIEVTHAPPAESAGGKSAPKPAHA